MWMHSGASILGGDGRLVRRWYKWRYITVHNDQLRLIHPLWSTGRFSWLSQDQGPVERRVDIPTSKLRRKAISVRCFCWTILDGTWRFLYLFNDLLMYLTWAVRTVLVWKGFRRICCNLPHEYDGSPQLTWGQRQTQVRHLFISAGLVWLSAKC